MKKKFLSLLLAAVILMTSVSVGFGALTAYAGAVGESAEAIKAFSLVDSNEAVTGTSFGTKITVKSNLSGYQIKVNSITAKIVYSENDTSVLDSVSVSYTAGTVCGTSGQTFDVSGTIAETKAGLIRYECSYDLLDSNGAVVYGGLTGYGYGYVSSKGAETGALGTETTPATVDDDWKINSFGNLNTLYVQTPTISLSYKITTDKIWMNGVSSKTYNPSVKSGTAPSSMTLNSVTFPYKNSFGSDRTQEGTWLTMNETTSGYYNFTVYLGWDKSGTTTTVDYYYRADGEKASALSAANTYLAKNLEKSYYTEASWNNYLKALESAQLAGRAYAQANYPFKIACQTAASAASKLAEAENALVWQPADYTALDNAYAAYNEIKDKEIDVRIYINYEQLATEFIPYYDSTAKAELESYYAACDRSLYKYQQKTVDTYTATLTSMTENLACADAKYDYLNMAIKEFYSLNEKNYDTKTWNTYKIYVNDAEAISKDLKTDSQDQINTALINVFGAKNGLSLVPADISRITELLAEAEKIKKENDNGNLLGAAQGFAECWEAFETACENAEAVQDYRADKQDEVDAAADELASAITVLYGYRLLDTSELIKVCTKTPKYDKSKYVETSYSTWELLCTEGVSFSSKASPEYTGDDRKTYNDYDEMERLIALINSAYDNLEKVKADFTELNKAVASIPADDVLALYEESYVTAIKNIVKNIDYGATFDEQDEVDAFAEDLKLAVSELTPAHYRKADYSGVDSAIMSAYELDRNIYTNFEIVDNAINAVDRTKNITEQSDVDAMEKAIKDAIAKLEFILADYTDVDAAIKEAEAVEHPDWYANYYRITEIIESIDRSKTLQQQDEVDAYAAAIREAIAALTLAEADYSGIKAAQEAAKELEPLKDFTDESVERLDLAISKVKAGYTKDKQSEVDAMEAEIRDAIAKMELLPADYTKANVAKEYAATFNAENYRDFSAVTAALKNIDENLNCRQQDTLDEQVKAVYAALSALQLKLADYKALDAAVEAANNACVSGDYPYTDESIQAVKDEIAKIDYELDIEHQKDVDAYIPLIEAAVAKLQYVVADYSGLEEVLAFYSTVDRSLYTGLSEIDSYIEAIDRTITIDRQSEVDEIVAYLNNRVHNLEYADADYGTVDSAIRDYENLERSYYDEDDLVVVDAAVEAVVRGYKKDKQADVDAMADNITKAIDALKAKIKPADLTGLNNAVKAAKAKAVEMQATGYKIDAESANTLDVLLDYASKYEGSSIDKQTEIDDLASRITEATANLEYVFTVDLSDTDLVIDGNLIYGFEEGSMSSDAEQLIKFVGPAKMVITETRNGFGTGTVIQFISTKDNSVLCSYIVVVFGDANGDAVIDMFDVSYISEIVNTGSEPNSAVLKAIDFEGDGWIDSNDVTIMIGLANMDATIKQDGSMERY